METNTKNLVPHKNRRSIWPFLIIGLLAAHVTGMVIAVTITEHDKTFLVVPDYYDKAQHWDAAQAERRVSASLGWNVLIEPAAAIDERGNRAVRFMLSNAQGQPLPNASMEVQYFHHAHPDQQQKARLTVDAGDPRAFAGMLAMPYAGVWEFHVTAHAGGRTFEQTQTPYVVSQRQMETAGK